MVNIDTVRKNYPLHWLVWHNSYVELDKELSTNQVCIKTFAVQLKLFSFDIRFFMNRTKRTVNEICDLIAFTDRDLYFRKCISY